MKIVFKNFIPHLISISIFIAISFIYFSPILQGKILNQSDIIQSKGMEHEREIYKQKDQKEIYWTNSAFGGMPTYMLGASYPHDYILNIHKVLNFLPRPVNFLFLYFLSFYLLMLVLKIDWKLAILGSLAFGFSTYYIIIIGVGHLAKARAIAYFPMVIAGILLVFEHKKYLWGFVLSTLAVALELNTKHYQMTYYLLFAVFFLGLFFLIEAYKKQEVKNFLKELFVLLIAALLALGMNLTNILPTQEYVKHSIRGESILNINSDGSFKKDKEKGLSKEYITEYSYGINETFNLLIPRFMGGSNNENLGENSNLYKTLLHKTDSRTAKDFVSHVSTYWGKQPIVAAPAYIGAIVIFLAFIGFLFYEGHYKKWIISTIIFALLLSWGKNFSFLTDFFINYIPLYNKFRAVSSIQVLIEFSLPLLAVLGIHSFLNSDLSVEKKQKKLFIAISSLGSLLLFFILIGGSLFTFESPMDNYYAKYGLLESIIADRKSMLITDSLRSLLFILISGGILYLYLKEKIKKEIVISFLALLILLDLVGVDKRYLNEKSFVSSSYYDHVFSPSQADIEILKDTSYYRVMNLTRNPLTDGLTSYYHKQLGGYHAAKPRRLQDLFDFYLTNNLNSEILNMYNVKYFIFQDKNGKVSLQINDSNNGNAWFIKQFDFVKNEDEEILHLKNFDSKNVSVLNKKYKNKLLFKPYKDSLSVLKLLSYHPEKLIYESNNKQKGFAVFSDSFYKNGWKANIDGKPVEIYKVNYSLRGLVIPKGKHQILFKFEPEVIKQGGFISLISFILFLVLSIIAFLFKIRKKEEFV